MKEKWEWERFSCLSLPWHWFHVQKLWRTVLLNVNQQVTMISSLCTITVVKLELLGIQALFFSISDSICGDKCLTGHGKCICGNEMFQANNGYYCCTPKNVTCKKEDDSKLSSDVTCLVGQKLRLDKFCRYQEQCPTSSKYTNARTAATINCSHVYDQPCPRRRLSKWICSNSVNTTIKPFNKYCSIGVICPPTKNGPAFKQCYDPYVHLHSSIIITNIRKTLVCKRL